LNIRKCKAWIVVKFLLLDFILLIIPKVEITLRSSTLCNFLRILVILALMIMLIALCYVTLHFGFSGPICLPSSARNQMGSSRQVTGRNELLQFADRCNKLLELSLGTLPSPLLPDIPHPHIFFMTSGTACSSILFTYFVFFLWLPSSESSWLLWPCQHQTQCITTHACQHVKSLRFCSWQLSGKILPVAKATSRLGIFGSRAEPSGALFSIRPLIFLSWKVYCSSKFTKLMTVPTFLNTS
jgi:hypothetical protein